MHACLIALLIVALGQGAPSTTTPADGAALPAAPAGLLAEFVYPGATAGESGTSVNLRQATLTTPDAPATVLAFYESKFGVPLGANCFHGQPDGWVSSVNDSRLPGANDGSPPSIALHVLSREKGPDVLTVVISRVPGDDATHIVLLLVARA